MRIKVQILLTWMAMLDWRRTTIMLMSAAALYAACSGDETTSASGATTSTPTGGSGQSGTSTGGAGGVLFTSGNAGSGQGGEPPCVQQEAEATLINRPVDIIFVIDNSGSMSDEIEDVEEQIAKNFVNIIDEAEPPVDYRVVMVSEFGAHGSNAICIPEPLGGIDDTNDDGHCDTIPDEPVNGPRFFHHAPDNNNPGIDSHNALCQLGDQFGKQDKFGLQATGYQEVLRDDAFKFFVAVTDDRPDNEQKGCQFGVFDDDNDVVQAVTMADAWDAAVLTLSPAHFGTLAERNYSFHSIIALEPYMADAANPSGIPHPPDAALSPITTEECTDGARNPGVGYQALSIMTGGARFPSCGLDYTKMFELMAQGVIEGAAVACEFLIPEPPVGETLDLETVEVEFTSGGDVVVFTQVDSLEDCTPSSFYIEADLIKLCPEACAEAQASEDSEIDIKFGCALVPD